MSERASKSGIAAEAHQKILRSGINMKHSIDLFIYSKFEPDLAAEILRWVSDITGEKFDTNGDSANFCKVFRNGALLCK